MKIINYMVTSFKEFQNKNKKYNDTVTRLIGIYPTYREASFIISKASKSAIRGSKFKIKKTNRQPTTTKVMHYILNHETGEQK